jgi:hypothetical protein
MDTVEVGSRVDECSTILEPASSYLDIYLYDPSIVVIDDFQTASSVGIALRIGVDDSTCILSL